MNNWEIKLFRVQDFLFEFQKYDEENEKVISQERHINFS